jgi:hypothetical protein
LSQFKTWSASSLMTIQLCGEKFRRKHLEKDYRAAGVAAARGIAVNRVKNEAHKRQMFDRDEWLGEAPKLSEAPGTPRALEESKDVASREFEAAVRRGVSFTKDEQSEGTAKVLASFKDAAVALAGLYVSKVAPAMYPVAVERKIFVRPKDSDIQIVGYLDLVRKVEAGEVVPDVKTKDKSPFKNAAAVSSQLTMYAMLRRLEVGALPVSLELIHLVQTPKEKRTYVDIQETTRDETDVSLLVRRINVAAESVEKGVFVPADPASPGSPCGWCEFRGDCRFVRAPVQG